MAGSLSRRRFVAAARRYVPELVTADVVPGPHGIRAQALERRGSWWTTSGSAHVGGHGAAQRTVPGGDLEPGHRRAPGRRRARTHARSRADDAAPPRARPVGRAGVAVRRRPRARPALAGAAAGAGVLGLGPGGGGARRLRRGRVALPRGAARRRPHRDGRLRRAGRGGPLRPYDGGGGRPGAGLPRRRDQAPRALMVQVALAAARACSSTTSPRSTRPPACRSCPGLPRRLRRPRRGRRARLGRAGVRRSWPR